MLSNISNEIGHNDLLSKYSKSSLKIKQDYIYLDIYALHAHNVKLDLLIVEYPFTYFCDQRILNCWKIYFL